MRPTPKAEQTTADQRVVALEQIVTDLVDRIRSLEFIARCQAGTIASLQVALGQNSKVILHTGLDRTQTNITLT